MAKDCGCGGSGVSVSASARAAAAGPRFAIQLQNGTRVGDYPTRSHAEIANARVYSNKGKIVQQ